MPTDIPSEVDEATSLLNNPDEVARQEQILLDLNRLFPNNEEQQRGYNSIIHSIDEFSSANCKLLRKHQVHFIGGPGGTGKSALFKMLHTTCQSKKVLIVGRRGTN
jgi:hypothetical protein